MKRETVSTKWLVAVAFSVALVAPTTEASIVTFYGSTNGAGPGDPKGSAGLAETSFISNAGVGTVIDFEGLANDPGDVSGVTVATGATLTVTGNAGSNGGIVNNIQVRPLGFNTTTSGSKWLQMWPNINSGGATATFNFTSGIEAFGVYLTDTEVGFPGPITVTFNDGTAQSLPVTKGSNGGGIVFFGFTDVGASITSVSLHTGATGSTRDIWGLDDVRFVTTTSNVPEPATLALLSLGLAGLGFSRRKQ